MATGLDSLEALLALLASRTSITALTTSARLYASGLPGTYRGDQPAILAIENGGPADDGVALTDTDVWLHCYGPTPQSARTLAKTVAQALKNITPLDVTVTGGKARLATCRKTNGPFDVTEPVTSWMRCTLGYALRWVDQVV